MKMAQKLHRQLKELGSKFETLPNNKDPLLKLLKQATSCLSEVDQSPSALLLELMQPIFNEIAKPELLKHQDRDVKLLVATCLCEITRITAPEAPYSDDVLKDIFQLIVGTFSGLGDTNSPSFGRRVFILETLARYRSCVVMLDLECYDLVNEMFGTFFSTASDDHPENVMTSMQTIMVALLEESEEIREDLLLLILSNLGRNKNGVTAAARNLALNVIVCCTKGLEPAIKQFLVSSMSGDGRSSRNKIDYREVIYEMYCRAPQVLLGIIPYLTGELLADQLDVRLKAVNLVGDLFSFPGSAISEAFQPIFSEFLKRLTDRVVEIRMSVLEHIKNSLLSVPSRIEAPQILSALCDRLLDYDENVRRQVVAVICDVARRYPKYVSVETAKLLAERLRDKSLLVKMYTMERLAEMYKLYCSRCLDGLKSFNKFDWIPGKILRCFYDKDFRSDTIESVLSGSLFLNEFSIKDRIKHWVRVFSGLDKIEIKALERLLEQKQRLQQEMQGYLSLRPMSQNDHSPEIQKKIFFCFRIMSRWFPDPSKAEECFQILDQLKDGNIWKLLTGLLEPNNSCRQVCTYREELLNILGEKHRLYDFLSILSIKCSYLLFNKEHVKELLMEAAAHKISGNTRDLLSCMNTIVLIARFCPMLLNGNEEDLINLLKDDNDIIKEGILHVLASAGGTMREQLAALSSSVDLMLERLCLEGSRRQAKYAVHALAAITKDDGLKSLSVLYKRLVDMLEEKSQKTHLPAVLQSLGCIAQSTMPVFETRENEIKKFIKCNILEYSEKAKKDKKICWDDRSELCSLKIFGIKTLVKSYLPVKDAHRRHGVDALLGILKNVLLYGESSKDIESSSVDKAHLRLASAKAVLRLSKYWDHKIPIDVFQLTLRISEVGFPQARKQFLSKVHQYIKDRALDAKYASAFLLNMLDYDQKEFEEEKHNLSELIQMCHQTRARQFSSQCDTNSQTPYPENILPYLVHTLAHHSCPSVDECKDFKALEPIYRKLHLFLSMLVHGDEDGKSDSSSTKEKERFSAISSIFQGIKRSEDVVDPSKSKNSHAICELGLSITKRLGQKEDHIQDSSAFLPPLLYRLNEKVEEDDHVVNEVRIWLTDESILAHFESLKIEPYGTIVSVDAKDNCLEDNGEESEVPLGKMIRSLKSKGTKLKKVTKDTCLPANAQNDDDNVDILKMAREINCSGTKLTGKFETTNGHRYSPDAKKKLYKKHQKRKERDANAALSVPVPKRWRSSSTRGGQSVAKNSPEGSTQSVKSNSEDEMLSEKKPDTQTESDLLVSSLRDESRTSPKHKGKGSLLSCGSKARKVGHTNILDLKNQNKFVADDAKFNSISNSKVHTVSTKKRKRRSILGLAKCSMKEGEGNMIDLIGCRIKVWWPLDKQFYEGMVKSYDSQKNKHVVLYDDGDVEVLRLGKERWEFIDSGHKPGKKLKTSRSLLSSEKLPERISDLSRGSQKKRKSLQKFSSSSAEGRKTPKGNMKAGNNVVSESDFREDASRRCSNVPNAEPTCSGVCIEEMADSPVDGVATTDKLPGEKETEGGSNQAHDARMEERHESGGDDVDMTSDVIRQSGKEDARYSEEERAEAPDKSSLGFTGGEEGEAGQEEKEVTPKAVPTGGASNSDDEPLGVWKRRVGKPKQGKK